MAQVSAQRMTRRHMLKGAAAISGAVALGSALPSISFAQPIAPPTGGKVTVKLLSWFWWEPGRRDAWRYVIDQFHQSQSDVRIEEAGWNFDDFTNRIIVQLQSGKIDGDMIQTTPDLVLRLLKAGQLEPIESVVSAAGVTNLSSAHDFIKDANGHLYGLDMVSVAFGNLYNSALYSAAGIQDPAQSIDDWIDQIARLTNRDNNQYGIYSPHLLSEAEAFWFRLQEWALPYDGTWANGKTPMVTSDPIIKGLKLFKTMYDVGMPQGMDGASAVKAFSDGQIASQLAESAVVNVYKTNNPDTYQNLRSVPPPWPSRKSLVRIHPLTVNAQSPNKDAAKQFLTFLYTKENYQQLLQRALDVIPAYPDGMSADYLASLPWVSGYRAVNALSPTLLLGDFIYNNQEFGQIVITHFQDSLVNNVPVEDAMGAAQIELEALAGRLSAETLGHVIDSSPARTVEPATVLSSRFEEGTVSVRRRRNWLPYVLAVPILAYEVVFILYPIAQGIASSFTRTDVGRPVTFVGAANYQRMLTDPAFWTVIAHTLVYMLAVIAVSICSGLAAALIFNRPFVGRVLARSLLTLPWSFPDVPTVLVFVWILNPQFGVMNVFARLLPWIQQNQRWLLNADLAMLSIVLISAWKAFPFYSLVILAALQSIPSERYEAARVDGANALQLFRHIIMPGIAPTLLLLVVLAAIFSFKQFSIIYLLTGGGPAGATETLVVRIYNTAFRFYDFSYSATLGVAGFVMAMSIVILFIAAQRHDEAELAY